MTQWDSCCSIFSFLCSVLQIHCLSCPFPLAIVLSFLSSTYDLVGFVLLDLQFSVQCFVDHCLSCCPFLLAIVLSFLSSIYDLVGFVFLDLQFSVQCFVDHCLSCCPFLLVIVLSFLLQSRLSGVCVTRSLVSCVVFCRSLFVFLSLSFGALYCRSFFNL